MHCAVKKNVTQLIAKKCSRYFRADYFYSMLNVYQYIFLKGSLSLPCHVYQHG